MSGSCEWTFACAGVTIAQPLFALIMYIFEIHAILSNYLILEGEGETQTLTDWKWPLLDFLVWNMYVNHKATVCSALTFSRPILV